MCTLADKQKVNIRDVLARVAVKSDHYTSYMQYCTA